MLCTKYRLGSKEECVNHPSGPAKSLLIEYGTRLVILASMWFSPNLRSAKLEHTRDW
jgi:hypothetical protein